MQPTHVRYLVLLLLAIGPLCAYLTRLLSPFNTTLTVEFHVSNQAIGEVIAGFALGYFLFQVPNGILASAWGIRLVLTASGILWSSCAILGSFAESADQLRFTRIALGIAQAALVPCCAKAVADWFPLSRRGLISAVMTSGMQFGAILATGLSAQLLEDVGWRMLLRSYGMIGILWAVVFFIWFRNRPAEHHRVNLAERELIEAGKAPGTSTTTAADWRRLLVSGATSVSLWAFLVMAFFRAYAYEFFLTWCPAFLEKAYHLDAATAGKLATWPIVAVAFGSILSGFIVDAILVRTGSRWISRCGSAIVGLGLCAACFALTTRIENATLAAGVLAFGCLCWSLSGPATWAAGMDIGGRYTAVVFAVMNMVGNVGSFFCPRHVGRLFDSIEKSGSSWDLILWLFVGINLACAASWLLINPRRFLTS